MVERSPAELDALVDKLSLDRKVRLLTGATTWRTHDEPAIGLRAMVLSDGPIGVRGEHWDERDTSLALPSPTALAATFDEDLVTRMGGVLAAEARRKHVDVLLAPVLNLHRSPLGGRHFESFTEDPLLAARIGVAYVRGVQSGGVAATAKHYVANDSETERLTLSVRVSDAALHEVYLVPFEAAVAEGVWVVMSAYNAVGAATMTESPLLAEPLKGSWAFDGVVVSDWGAVRSTVESAVAAQDLAMPGPVSPWADRLVAAVESGSVPLAAVDDKVRRLLRLAERVGALGGSFADPSTVDALPLLRTAASAGTVLLRNENALLPLSPDGLRLAVLGPSAVAARSQGGGSAGVYPAAVVSPLEGITAAVGDRGTVTHTAGVHITAWPPALSVANARDPRSGAPGLLLRVLRGDGTELGAEHRLTGRVVEPACGDLTGVEILELRALLSPVEPGRWRLAVTGIGRLTLTVAGTTVFDETVHSESDDPAVVHVGPPSRLCTVDLPAGEVELVVRRWLTPDTGWVIGLGAEPDRRAPADELAAAVALAADSDVAVVVVGTTEEFESEGFDRTTLDLPGAQDDLVRAVAAVNPRTVVVVNSGGPVVLPWRNDVASVLQTWFGGQEAGHAVADVLFGVAEPGGRLPTTWAADMADVPVLDPTPVAGVLDYAEGVHIGHRAWLRSGAEPAYWFGHGLGYTTWSYDRVTVPAPVTAGEPFTVHVELRNTGQRPGREVVQVYLARLDTSVDRPMRWLAGYTAVTALSGAVVSATVTVAPTAVRHWSTADGEWRIEPGTYEVLVGRSAGDLPLRGSVTIV
ncbi:MAG TPA: glycoside hydrolase family 3 C-terminal domain-containing protein [Pseudonocardiaceae bacterium]|nr:glycoside hydrolase family 3 C-terminal domain-containing protein [Pseudonocardiaceae bacterium]